MSKTNKVLASKRIKDTSKCRFLFTRAAGTIYWEAKKKAFAMASESSVIVQLGGIPSSDSGHTAYVWEDTPTNRKKAWEAFNNYI